MVWTVRRFGSSAAPSCSPEALPFADKAYVTDLAATVDADSYAPDMASLVEAGMWREAEVGEWHTPAKEESGIDSYRFRILAKTK